MKKFLSALLISSMLSSASAFAQSSGTLIMFAMESNRMSVNGEIKTTDVAPFLYDSTTYLPIRAISEGFGAEVIYDGKANTVTVIFNNTQNIFNISDGINYKSRVYLPARRIMEAFGLKIEWYDGLIAISDSGEELNSASVIKAKSDLRYIGHKDRKFDYNITFSKPSGFYTDDFSLQLSTEMPDAKIYYTTDGSEPTVNSLVYSGSIEIKDRTFDDNTISMIPTAEEDFCTPSGKIFKATTIKAKAINLNGNSTPTVVNSYFVAKNIFTRYNVHVISITTPEQNLFDTSTGIYIPPNYTNKGSEWERDAYMEVFDPDGNCMLSQTVGLRINGAFTRKYQQKSFRVYARENSEYRNGTKKKFKYDFFNGASVDSSDEIIDSYKTIILRNAGDDWYNYFVRDGIVQRIAKPLNVDTTSYNLSVVFINGEYWGVHEIRERYDDDYFKSHYNLASSSDVAMIEISEDRNKADLSDGEEADLLEFNEEFSFVTDNDMSVSENYQKACSFFDIDNLIDYYSLNIYFENNDWPFNNIKIWKNKNPQNSIDTRWRWAVSDMDGTFENLEDNVIYTGWIGEAALKRWQEDKTGAMGYLLEDESCLMQRFICSLLKNDEFREKFQARYRECIENYFSYDKISPIIEDMTNSIAPLRSEHRQRYRNSWNMPTYTQLFMYANSRPAKALAELENYFK